jgi:hypothetical protein
MDTLSILEINYDMLHYWMNGAQGLVEPVYEAALAAQDALAPSVVVVADRSEAVR